MLDGRRSLAFVRPTGMMTPMVTGTLCPPLPPELTLRVASQLYSRGPAAHTLQRHNASAHQQQALHRHCLAHYNRIGWAASQRAYCKCQHPQVRAQKAICTSSMPSALHGYGPCGNVMHMMHVASSSKCLLAAERQQVHGRFQQLAATWSCRPGPPCLARAVASSVSDICRCQELQKARNL